MRVIAGEARGRSLEALPGTDVTRPTLSQVKEAMFSIVQFDLPGARVLDLYAGSGQLGIEALSRGAARCVFLDENREAVNIIMRNCSSENASRVLWLKMRPDTPQQYENVRVEGITGKARSFLVIRPWTQFFKPQNRPDMPKSYCRHITMKNINMDCNNFFDVAPSDKYDLSDFTFENIRVNDKKNAFSSDVIPGTVVRKVVINSKKYEDTRTIKIKQR